MFICISAILVLEIHSHSAVVVMLNATKNAQELIFEMENLRVVLGDGTRRTLDNGAVQCDQEDAVIHVPFEAYVFP